MKSSKLILRLVQILTGLLVVFILGALLVYSGVISLDGFGQHSSADTGKIQRPKETSNKSTQELIYSGDRAFFAGNLDAALAFYQSASQSAPREALPYEKIRDVHFIQTNYESALQNFRLAATLNPQNQGLILKSTRSLLGLRKIDEANTEVATI